MTRRTRVESDRDKYLRIVGALRVLQPLAETDSAARAVIAAELAHADTAKAPPPMPERPVVILPGRVAAYIADPEAFVAWAVEQDGEPLQGARLGHEVAAALARQQPVPGLTFRSRSAVALVHVGPAYAISQQQDDR